MNRIRFQSTWRACLALAFAAALFVLAPVVQAAAPQVKTQAPGCTG